MRKSVYRRRFHAKGGATDEPGTLSTPTRRIFGSTNLTPAAAGTASIGSSADGPLQTPLRCQFGFVRSQQLRAATAATSGPKSPQTATTGTRNTVAENAPDSNSLLTPAKVRITLPEDDALMIPVGATPMDRGSPGSNASSLHSKSLGLLEVPTMAEPDVPPEPDDDEYDAFIDDDEVKEAEPIDRPERGSRLARISPSYVVANSREAMRNATTRRHQDTAQEQDERINRKPSSFFSMYGPTFTESVATVVGDKVFITALKTKSPLNDNGGLDTTVSIQKGSVAPSKMVTFQIASLQTDQR